MTHKEFPTEPAAAGLLHAWFSEKQSRFGTAYYKTNAGEEVECSMVGTPAEAPGFDDTLYLGLVLHYSIGGMTRRGRQGAW